MPNRDWDKVRREQKVAANGALSVSQETWGYSKPEKVENGTDEEAKLQTFRDELHIKGQAIAELKSMVFVYRGLKICSSYKCKDFRQANGIDPQDSSAVPLFRAALAAVETAIKETTINIQNASAKRRIRFDTRVGRVVVEYTITYEYCVRSTVLE